MTKFQTKLTTAFATGAVLLNALAPLAAADTTLTISGNGSNSSNATAVSSTTTNSVVQTNTANISNNVDVSNNTGGNTANNNTGGDVAVTSGNATTAVAVQNTANSNSANLTNCNCDNDVNATISGNGTNSDNTVALDNHNTTALYQTNVANVSNNVDVNSKTGHNTADNNTGGDVKLTSGNANTTVVLGTTANANTAMFGGAGAGANQGGTVNAVISGNGSYSDSAVALDLGNDVLVTQTNVAHVTNDVDVDSYTGGNSADDNTGGDVVLTSGNVNPGANTGIAIDNAVNFNAANLDDCACMTDLTAWIKGNGTESDNAIAFAGDNVLGAFQTNVSDLNNDVDAHNKTGWNTASGNTGDVDFANDPSLTSGNSKTVLDLSNTGNSNTLGQGSMTDDFDFDWNWAAIMAMFMSH